VRFLDGSAATWVKYRLGLVEARSQTTPAERDCLVRHARGRRSVVEIGVMHGVNTGLLRSVMDPSGTITGIDPLPPGRLRVSFERWIAERELARHPRGRAVLLRKLSWEAALTWKTPIDFLFVDGDHSWAGIERDWRDWSGLVIAGGILALHDSREVPGQTPPESVRFTAEVVLADPRFRTVDAVDSLTVLQRL
jgi:predicted O-methyltransferase YrrM